MPRLSKRKRDERRFGKPERLADQLSSVTWRVPDWCGPMMGDSRFLEGLASCREQILGEIGQSAIVAADNVGEFFYATNPKEEWDYQKDFPSCVPPFPLTFVETGRPSRLLSGTEVKSSSTLPERWGWLFHCERRSELLEKVKAPESQAYQRNELEMQIKQLQGIVDPAAIHDAATSPDAKTAWNRLGDRERTYVALLKAYQRLKTCETAGDFLPDQGEWFVRGALVATAHSSICFLAECTFAITSDGSVLLYPVFRLLGGHLVDSKLATDLRDTYNSMLFPALLALSFMNCKNVALSAVEPDVKLNRERRKAGLKPFLRYHTIDIEPMKTVLRSEGGIETNGLKKALHICRGHFAHYTEDRPLFGRAGLHGSFWMPSHVRGSAKQGVVASDYRVGAPTAEPRP